jgi:4-hydroxybenzoate polyprenyltransferase
MLKHDSEPLVTRARTVSGHDIHFSHAPEAMVTFVGSGRQVVTSPLERLRIVVMLGRPRTCVPGLLAFALGYSYTGGGSPGRLLLGALLALSIGLSANLHNAAIDLHEDSRNLPGRVWLLAKLGYRPLMRVCRTLAVAMLIGGIALGWYFGVFMALAVVGLHQYSAPPIRSKGRPILGLWVFAQAVVFPFLFGWTTEPGRMFETLLASIAAPFGATRAPPAAEAWQSWRYLGMWAFLTLWFMAKGTFKNVPDFAGDSVAHLRTSATICGTRRRAALVAAAATLLAYASLAVLVGLGLEGPRAGVALLWLAPVAYNCVRLVHARDGATGNAILRADMLISSGFVATLLLLIAPTVTSLVAVGAGTLLFVASDWLGLDSRREADALVRVAPDVAPSANADPL